MNLQDPLVQSSKWFDISSVEFSALVISWSGSILQFSSKYLRSVQFIQLISRTLLALTQMELAGSVGIMLGPVHRIPNYLGGAEESYRFPPSEIPARRHGVCRPFGRMAHFARCACLPRIWCGVGNEANSVQKSFR